MAESVTHTGLRSAEARRGDLLARFLADRHEPCPGCGYDLHGLLTRNCPECNQALRLRIMPREPKMAGWVAGLIGLAVPTGTAALLLAFVIVIVAVRSSPPARWFEMVAALSVTGLAGGSALAAWVRWSGWIRARLSAVRGALVAGAWVLCVVTMVLMYRLLQ